MRTIIAIEHTPHTTIQIIDTQHTKKTILQAEQQLNLPAEIKYNRPPYFIAKLFQARPGEANQVDVGIDSPVHR
ncbi:MAG: hypothetical protein WCY88_03445 [Spongiibacteraceae bacterium]